MKATGGAGKHKSVNIDEEIHIIGSRAISHDFFTCCQAN